MDSAVTGINMSPEQSTPGDLDGFKDSCEGWWRLGTSSNASVGENESLTMSRKTLQCRSSQGHCGDKRGGGGTIKGSIVTQRSVDGVLGPSNAPSVE